MLQASDFFDFPGSLPFAEFFSADAAPWEWLPHFSSIGDSILGNKAHLGAGVKSPLDSL